MGLSLEEMPGLSFNCRCGRNHVVDISRLVVRDGVIDEIIHILVPFHNGKLFIMSDTNTYDVFGRTIINRLEHESFRYKSFIFAAQANSLVPDEYAIGRLLAELEQEASLILAVGSGVLNDLARFIGYRTNKPYAIAGTAPSMDGYASIGSPLIIQGIKTTYPGKYPYAIFADTRIMRNAPMVMIQAGYGDVLGKLTALADWQLSEIINGEYYCETTAKLVQKGVRKCIESTDGLPLRQEYSIKCLIEALILTGISMGLVGISRPASGTEHLLAHYWEMKSIAKGSEHALHGNAVGVGTVIAAMLYEMAAGMLPEGIEYPPAEHITALLGKIGAAVNPGELGIDRELFIDSMMNAMNIRDKYTILQFCENQGKLKDFTEMLTGRFYD